MERIKQSEERGSSKRRDVTLLKLVGESCTDTVPSEHSPEENEGDLQFSGGSIPSRKNGKCKCPGAGVCLQNKWNRKETIVAAAK